MLSNLTSPIIKLILLIAMTYPLTDLSGQSPPNVLPNKILSDSIFVLNDRIEQSESKLKSANAELDTVSRRLRTLSQELQSAKRSKFVADSNHTKLKKKYIETQNTLAQVKTNYSQEKGMVSRLRNDSLSFIQEILKLKDTLVQLSNKSLEEKRRSREELADALKDLSAEKRANNQTQEILKIEAENNQLLENSLRGLTENVVDLNEEITTLTVHKDSLTTTKAELEETVADLQENASFYKYTIYAGILLIAGILFYVIWRIWLTVGIDDQLKAMKEKIKVNHPMMEETLIHYLRYKHIGHIMRHTVILVTVGTLVFVLAMVIINFETGQANALFEEDFWKMISGIGLPLVLTISIFNGVEEKKIETAKILFDHHSISGGAVFDDSTEIKEKKK